MRKRFILLTVLGFTALCAHAQPLNVRKELGEILKATQQALKSGDFSGALSDLAVADTITDKTPEEETVVEQMRVIAALNARQPDIAANSFQRLNDIGRLSPLNKLQFSQGIAAGYVNAGNMPGAIAWAAYNVQSGGTNAGIQQLAAQAPPAAPAAGQPAYALPPGVVPPSR